MVSVSKHKKNHRSSIADWLQLVSVLTFCEAKKTRGPHLAGWIEKSPVSQPPGTHFSTVLKSTATYGTSNLA